MNLNRLMDIRQRWSHKRLIGASGGEFMDDIPYLLDLIHDLAAPLSCRPSEPTPPQRYCDYCGQVIPDDAEPCGIILHVPMGLAQHEFCNRFCMEKWFLRYLETRL